MLMRRSNQQCAKQQRSAHRQRDGPGAAHRYGCVALIDEMSSRRVGDAGLRQSALKPTAAIDLEAPLIEVGEEDGPLSASQGSVNLCRAE